MSDHDLQRDKRLSAGAAWLMAAALIVWSSEGDRLLALGIIATVSVAIVALVYVFLAVRANDRVSYPSLYECEQPPTWATPGSDEP